MVEFPPLSLSDDVGNANQSARYILKLCIGILDCLPMPIRACNMHKDVCCGNFHINKLIWEEFPPLSHSDDVGNANQSARYTLKLCIGILDCLPMPIRASNMHEDVCCVSFHINKLIWVEFPPLSHSDDVGNEIYFDEETASENMCEAAYGNFHVPILDCKDSFFPEIIFSCT
ncbi:hypothetical protein CDAR_563451 [Caerostris darwini]|uniref:Uncharacterized protein n=1 Tax=Caerostris darwini TaxID=1538125 RepID=A0AAV4WHS3_9ARAC|nr:hypothetical protein CDAR_563451 [Caerostris darwini]